VSDSCRDKSLGNACLLKLAEDHPENSSYLTAPLRDPIREEANRYNNTNGCTSYYYGKRIGMIMI
jgi:hypothetical protein